MFSPRLQHTCESLLLLVGVKEVFPSDFFESVKSKVCPEHSESELVLMVEVLPDGVVTCADFLLVVLEQSNVRERDVDIIISGYIDEGKMRTAPDNIILCGYLAYLYCVGIIGCYVVFEHVADNGHVFGVNYCAEVSYFVVACRTFLSIFHHCGIFGGNVYCFRLPVITNVNKNCAVS